MHFILIILCICVRIYAHIYCTSIISTILHYLKSIWRCRRKGFKYRKWWRCAKKFIFIFNIKEIHIKHTIFLRFCLSCVNTFLKAEICGKGQNNFIFSLNLFKFSVLTEKIIWKLYKIKKWSNILILMFFEFLIK